MLYLIMIIIISYLYIGETSLHLTEAPSLI